MLKKSKYYCNPLYELPEEGKMKVKGTGQAFITDAY